MTKVERDLLALDVGGANVKAADSRGAVWSVPFELWKAPERLPDVLRAGFAGRDDPDHVALTMTGELCDCFETKAEGVRSIVKSARISFPKSSLRIWGRDERFYTTAELADAPEVAAAANWSALANVAAARFAVDRPALLIDIGSTTTDIVPLRSGRAIPNGRTDFERLRTRELVYIGARRTPLCALATETTLRGDSVGVMAEWFATTLDVYLMLGMIAEDPRDRATADGRPATVSFARDRLARTIGADRSTIDLTDAIELARAADSVALDRLTTAARRVVESIGETPKAFVVSGSGAFLAERLVARIATEDAEVVSLAERWGEPASSAACAYALAILAREDGRF